jgi:hypothetical protein
MQLKASRINSCLSVMIGLIVPGFDHKNICKQQCKKETLTTQRGWSARKLCVEIEYSHGVPAENFLDWNWIRKSNTVPVDDI